jgi:outer membrane lipoprotein-sorting protein
MKSMMLRKLKLTLFFLPSLFFSPHLFAESPEEKGRNVFSEMDRRETGFGDFSARQEMILRNASGQESRRIMDQSVLEDNADGDKTLIIFREPKKVRGTALLTHAHGEREDDQWLYLPKLGRVKRISGSSKAGSFLGSEFAYEDLAPQEVDDYSYKYLRDENLVGQDMFVVERTPKSADSGYTRQIVWVDKKEYRIFQADFYDRKDSHAKRLTISDYKLYLDKYWRPLRLTMVNQTDGRSTDLIMSEYVFQENKTADDFSQATLRRAR